MIATTSPDVSLAAAPDAAATSVLYFDGLSSRKHNVVLRRGSALEIIENGTFIAAWAYPDIRRADAAPDRLRLRSVAAGPLARLEIEDPALQAEIIAACPLLDGERGEHEVSTLRIVAWSIAAAASILAIVWFGVPFAADRIARIIPISIEKRIGDVAANQVKTVFGDKTCINKDGVAALNKLVGELQSKAGLRIPLTAGALASSVPNAFALPGGRVFVLKGLLDKAQSPDEVAGVLAHELGHVAHRDGLRLLIENGGTSYLLGLLFGDVSGAGAVLMAGRSLIQSHYSREAEANADLFARELMVALGRSPRPLGDLLVRITGTSKPGPLSIFASHPLTADRQAALEKADAPVIGPPLLSDAEWTSLKAICK